MKTALVLSLFVLVACQYLGGLPPEMQAQKDAMDVRAAVLEGCRGSPYTMPVDSPVLNGTAQGERKLYDEYDRCCNPVAMISTRNLAVQAELADMMRACGDIPP